MTHVIAGQNAVTELAVNTVAAEVVPFVARVNVRTVDKSDTEAVKYFFNGLSPTTLYYRFFVGFTSVPSGVLANLVVNTASVRNLVAVVGAKVVGHALWAINAMGTAEFALVVSEDHRRQGIATMLFRSVLDQATLFGANQIQLDVLHENRAMTAWVKRFLPGIRLRLDGTVVTGRMSIDRSMVASMSKDETLAA